MAINTIQGFNPSTTEPIDSRTVVANSSSRFNIPVYNAYEGLLVFQKDTNELYSLIDTGSISSSSGWQLVGRDIATGSFATTGSNIFDGNQTITGSLNITNGITGSLQGTSSFAINALTASFITPIGTNAFVQGGNSFGTQALLGTNDNNNLALETSGSVRMFISSSGNIGIGTTTPTSTLQTIGSSGISSIIRSVTSDGNGIADIHLANSSASPLHLTRYGGNVPINLNSAGGTALSPAFISSNVAMSRFTTNAFNGTAFSNAARIEVLSQGIHSSTNLGTLMRFQLTAENTTSLYTSLALLSNGNVQIGADFVSPIGAKLGIRGTGATSSTTTLRIENSNASASMVVLDNGSVGIGTNNPANSKVVIDASGTNRQGLSATALTVDSQGITSGSNITAFRDGGGSSVLTIRSDGQVTFGIGATINPIAISTGGINITGQGLSFRTNDPSSGGRSFLFRDIGNITTTSGFRNIIEISDNFSPVSGDAIFNSINIANVINQTGGANGITRGLYINPTLTSAANFRAIETTSGNILFGSGSTPLLFVSQSGNIGIGTNTPTYKLHISSSNNNDSLAIHYIANNSTLFPFIISSNTDTAGNYVRINTAIIELKRAGAASTIRTVGSANPLNLQTDTGNIVILPNQIETLRVGPNALNISGSVNISGSGNFSANLTVTGSTILQNGQTTIQGSSATTGNALVVRNSTPVSLYTIQNNGQQIINSPMMVLNNTGSAFNISHNISHSAVIGAQVYGINYQPTFFGTTGSQTETAFRINATFTGSAVATGGTNIITDFGSNNSGTQFSVTDVISGSIYMVNDVSGLPIIEATSDWGVKIWDFPNVVLEKTGSVIKITGSLQVTGSLIMSPTSSFVLPLTASNTPQTGSAYWSGSFLFVWNGTRYMSSSFN